MNEQRIRMDQKIQTMATRLSKSLDVNMRKSFLPDERKALRRFSSTEVAQILGVSQDFLRKMFFEDKLNLGDIETDARVPRFYTAEQIDIARTKLPGQAPSSSISFLVVGMGSMSRSFR